MNYLHRLFESSQFGILISCWYIEHKLERGMSTLEHRRIEQSLTIFYKCYKENGPSYLADLFEPRITPYNLRNTGLNVTQNSYNSKFRQLVFICHLSYLEQTTIFC